jgi:hypothetical protein
MKVVEIKIDEIGHNAAKIKWNIAQKAVGLD